MSLLARESRFCLIDSLIKGREDAMPQDGHAYTPAPTQPKDLEEALLDDSIDHQSGKTGGMVSMSLLARESRYRNILV
jgi:hypothetical protein